MTTTKIEQAYNLLGLDKDVTINAVAAVFAGSFAAIKPRYMERSVDSLVVAFATKRAPYGDGEKLYHRTAELGHQLTLTGLRDFKIFSALWLRDYNRNEDMIRIPRDIRIREVHSAVGINELSDEYIGTLNRPSAQTFLMARAILNHGGFFKSAALQNPMPARGAITTDSARLSPQL